MSFRSLFHRSSLEGPLYERAVFLISCLFVLVIPVMGIFAHRGFAPSLFILSIVCGANILVWRQTIERVSAMRVRIDYLMLCALAFILFCLWIAITTLWTPLEGRVTLFLNVLMPVVSTIGVFWAWQRLSTSSVYVLSVLYCVLVFATLCFLATETVTDAFLRAIVPPKDTSWNRHDDFVELGRGTGALILMVFPAILLFKNFSSKIWPIVLVLAIASVSALGLGIFSNFLALVTGVVAVLFTLRYPKTGTILVAASVLLSLWLSPLIASFIPAQALNEQLSGVLPVSWLQRFYIWETIGDVIPAGLPFGHGVDYARWMSIDSPTVDIPGAYGPLPLVPTHPHNVFLQIWLELGLPGALFFSAAIVLGAKALVRLDLTPALIGGVAALAAAVLVSFSIEASLWQVWRLAVIGIAALGLFLANKTQPLPT